MDEARNESKISLDVKIGTEIHFGSVCNRLSLKKGKRLSVVSWGVGVFSLFFVPSEGGGGTLGSDCPDIMSSRLPVLPSMPPPPSIYIFRRSIKMSHSICIVFVPDG